MIAIYARQSVNKSDSISIETQIEDCEKELRRGESAAIYADRGYSGKNTDRPEFQRLLEDIRRGSIDKVICYKLDRISRSVLDFSSLVDIFAKYKVDFVSRSEKFDTSTPMGRAMLNICIVFAQLERETIQQRVTDTYTSRSRKGFYMGGRCPYGYRLEPYSIDGVKTSRYTPVREEAEILKLIYSLYAKPQISLGDLVKYLAAENIKNPRDKNGNWNRSRLSELMKSPIYVKASIEVYNFFRSHGTIIHNPPEDFIGTNGCYLYAEKEAPRKTSSIEGCHLVLASHEGIIDPDVWLTVRKKCLGNKQTAKPIKAKNTWLAGKIKCAKCGYALNIRRSGVEAERYFICSRKGQTIVGCEGVGGLRADEIEAIVFDCIREKLKDFPTLSPPITPTEDPKTTQLKIISARLSDEINSWVSKVPHASPTLMAIINQKLDELEREKISVENKLQNLTTPTDQKNEITDYISKWQRLTLPDKISVVDLLISVIRADKEHIEIEWKI